MKKENNYSVSADIARRSGVISSRYRTEDGRFLLSERDLQNMRFRMTADEFVHGLDAKLVSDEEMQELIRKGGYQLGEKAGEPAGETAGVVEAEGETAGETTESEGATEPEGEASGVVDADEEPKEEEE